MSWVENLQKFILLSFLLLINSSPLPAIPCHCMSTARLLNTQHLNSFAMTRGMLIVSSSSTKYKFRLTTAFQEILHLGLSSSACNFKLLLNFILYGVYCMCQTLLVLLLALETSFTELQELHSFSAQKGWAGKLCRALKPPFCSHSCPTSHCFSGTIDALFYSD